MSLTRFYRAGTTFVSTAQKEGKRDEQNIKEYFINIAQDHLIRLEDDNTYGTVNSKMLLRTCFSSMITAIWMKRSVRQPLG